MVKTCEMKTIDLFEVLCSKTPTRIKRKKIYSLAGTSSTELVPKLFWCHSLVLIRIFFSVSFCSLVFLPVDGREL